MTQLKIKKLTRGDHANNNNNDLSQPTLMVDNKEAMIHPPPFQIINHIMLLLFWSTALFWDTLAYFSRCHQQIQSHFKQVNLRTKTYHGLFLSLYQPPECYSLTASIYFLNCIMDCTP